MISPCTDAGEKQHWKRQQCPERPAAHDADIESLLGSGSGKRHQPEQRQYLLHPNVVVAEAQLG